MKVTSPEELGFSSDRLIRINDFMKRYVNEGMAAGIVTLVARRGEIVYLDKYGYQNIEAEVPMMLDTIFRIYSMTKPITSVALMMLFERGLVRLEDPVSKFIPQFKDTKVHGKCGTLVDLIREITVHDLLTHTAGLSYGGIEETKIPVDEFYDKADLFNTDINLEEMVRRTADLPLAYQPGTVWHYSVATDVVGRLVELIADMPLSDFFQDKIFQPLGMQDTAFSVLPVKADRLSTLYGKSENDDLEMLDGGIYGDYFKVKLYAGGSGLVSTISDYFRFAQFVLNKGELEGQRLLGTKTVDLMTANHIPNDLLPISMGDPMPGIGFGLGFSVIMDVPMSGMIGSPGVHGWGGWANTNFWIDQLEGLIGILMMQYITSETYHVRNDFRTAVYQALIE
jgi:CubicO group peptidase (beta-lactamase class C family)